MKLVTAAVFFIVIAITQFLSSQDKDVSLEQHVQLQQELSSLIANYVKENLPNMTDFKMLSVYTKTPEKGKIQAYFNYKFKTPTQETSQLAETELSGYATLQKIKNEPNPEWALDKINVEGESVTFNEPIVITPSQDGTVTKTPEATSKQ